MSAGELPNGWRWAKVGDVCELCYGQSLPNRARSAGIYQVFGSSGPIGTHDEALTRSPAIIVGRKGGAGLVAFSEHSCWPIDTAFYVDGFSKVVARYLFHVLNRLELTKRLSTTAIPSLSRESVYSLSIPVPPPAEQRRIADTIDAAIAEAEAAARAAEAQGRAITEIGRGYANRLIDALADAHGCVRLDRLAPARNAFRDGPFGSNLKTAHYSDTGARVVRLQNIGDGEFFEQHRAHIPLAHFETIRGHEAIADDVIVAALGDGARSAGRACVMPKLDTPAVVKADCFRIRPPSLTLRSKFLAMGLNSSFVRTQLTSQLRGATRPRVNLEMLRAVSFPAVPIKLQDCAIEQMEEVNSEITSARLALVLQRQAIAALPASLLTAAFQGQL